MPVDRMMVDPMLDPFRGMLADCQRQAIAGPDFDEMAAALARLEQLAQETPDIGTYVARVQTEDLFTRFSNAYSRALSNSAQAKSLQAAAGDDDAMLRNTLAAYEEVIARLKEDPRSARYIPAVQRALELGRSGISYPVFLRRLEEEGLSDAMQGAAITREGLLESVHFAAAAHFPLDLEVAVRHLRTWDELAARARFKTPDIFEFNLATDRIDWEYASRRIWWQWVSSRWQKMLDDVCDWLDSFCSFAPWDSRWRVPGASEAQVRRNILHDQQCLPGHLRVREELFRENFGLTWDEIFAHPTFVNEYRANRLQWSDARFDLMRATYPLMQPGQRPAAELIKRSEELYAARAHVNPLVGQTPKLPVTVS